VGLLETASVDRLRQSEALIGQRGERGRRVAVGDLVGQRHAVRIALGVEREQL